MQSGARRVRVPALSSRRAIFATFVALLDAWLPTSRSWAQALPLTLDVKEPLGLARSHWPVTTGVPFPQGSVHDVSSLRITDGSGVAPVQGRILSRWPDGSARWALLDWQVDLKAHQERQFRVEPGVATAAVAAVKLNDTGERIEVDTGPLQFAIPKTRFALFENVRLKGAPVSSGPVVAFFNIDGKRIEAQAPAEVKVVEGGPQRVRVELRGHYAAEFDYVVRVDAFANQPFVRVFHSFEQHSSEPYTTVRQIGIELPVALKGKVAYSAGREDGAPLSGALPSSGFSMVQDDNDGFRVGGTRRPGHAAGWVDLHDATHGLAVVARFFWQEYPQSVQLRPTGLTYNLWAPEAPPAKIGMGAAKTHEMVFLFHDKTAPSPTMLAALQRPLLAGVDPQWIASSRALRNSISRSTATAAFLRELSAAYGRYQTNADAERWDDSGQVRCPPKGAEGTGAAGTGAAGTAHGTGPERPRHGFYGMFNWGDWNFPGYHDTTKGCDAWGNLEYDMTQVLALAYAATGERAYYDGMVSAARHFTDVDHVYSARARSNFVGMNHPKNPLHFSFELGGVDLGHTWTEGLLSYYYLTGDTRSLDAARGIADYLVRRLRALALKGNPRQFGWPQIALVATYEATGDEQYKAAAVDYARRGMTAYPADKIAEWKMGILAEAIAYTHSVSGDSAMRDWLMRYAQAVRARGEASDPRYFPAIAYVGRIAGRAEDTHAAAAAVERVKFGNWAKPFTIAGRLGFSILSQLPASQ